MYNKIPYIFNQQTVFIPKRLWYIMYENKHLDSLAYYIQLKKKFRNGVIYSQTNKYLSEITKTSISCTRKHKSILAQYELIKIDNKITLPNPKKLTNYANNNGKIYLCGFKILDSLKNQKYFVKNYSNLCSLKKQESQIKIETDSTKSLRQKSRLAMKKASLLEHKRILAPKSILYKTLSINTWANKLNKTFSTAKRHKKKLVELGIIEQFQRFELTNMKISDLLFLRKSRHAICLENFNKYKIVNGYVCTQLSNEINLVYLP